MYSECQLLKLAQSVQLQILNTLQLLHTREIYTVNQKKTWQYIFDYNFAES